MEFVSSLPLGGDEAGALEHFEMLGDALARHADLVLHQQTRTELEECLSVPLAEFVQDCSAYRRYDGFKDIGHIWYRQVVTCL